MIDLHFWPTPNGWKITIFLEECGLPYSLHTVNIGRGEQFAEAFLAVAPNNRIPAITDREPADGGPPLSLFESGAILEYLADKTGRFLPPRDDPRARFAVLQWLYWQVGGLGPMAGQNGHFALYAADKIPYAIDRYGREVRRLYGVLDGQLGRTGDCIAGEYSIADMAAYPWIMTHKRQGIRLEDYPHLARWYADLRQRPALQRGLAVGRELWSATFDDQAREVLFGQNQAAAGGTPP